VVDLQTRLSKAQEDLQATQDNNFKLWLKLLDCKSDLKRERYINKIAWSYIPEEQRDDYMHDWPNGQMIWSGRSSPSPASGKFQYQ
jgi:hypothetical protein